MKYVIILCRDSDDFLEYRNNNFTDVKRISRFEFEYEDIKYICISELFEYFINWFIPFDSIIETEEAKKCNNYNKLKELIKI